MEEKGSICGKIAGINDKRQIILTLAGSLSGELPLQLLYQGKKRIGVIQSMVFLLNYLAHPKPFGKCGDLPLDS